MAVFLNVLKGQFSVDTTKSLTRILLIGFDLERPLKSTYGPVVVFPAKTTFAHIVKK